MGNKRKTPVSIDFKGTVEATSVADGLLPAFRKFLDIPFETTTRKELTRWFFTKPTSEDIVETAKLYDSLKGSFSVVSAFVPCMHRSKLLTRPPLFEYCLNLGFSDEFAESIVRLLIHFLVGKRYGSSVIRHKVGAIECFVSFVAESKINPAFTITDIDKEVWLDFLEQMENDPRTTSKGIFNTITQIFCSHKITDLSGWLKNLSFRSKNVTKLSLEHSSELSDAAYSDFVMFQLLARFIETIERRIGYLKRFETLNETDLPPDWLSPSSSGLDWLTFEKGGKNNKRVSTAILEKWLNDKTEGYQILIDHHIIYHKLGQVESKNRFSSRLLPLTGDTTKSLVKEFYKTMGLSHGYRFGNGIFMLMSFYIKRRNHKRQTWLSTKLLGV